MTNAITIERIAELTEVSRSTVSRVLNNHPNVRSNVRMRVLKVMHDYNYTPHAAARSLAGSRTDTINLLVPRTAGVVFAEPFFSSIIESVAETCSKLGYFLMLSMITPEMEQSFYHRVLRGRHIDGVILASHDIDDPILPLLIKDRVPLVLIGSHPYLQTVSCIDAENREGARQAVAHLIGLGHSRIGAITGPLQMEAAIARRNGYKQALLEAGIPINPTLIAHGDFTQESGYRAMQRLLLTEPRPTAVFAASDLMADGALRAIREAGLVVPDDLALVGFDDSPLAQYSNPPLTSIRQPLAEMGSTAVQTLIDQIRNPDRPTTQLYLPTTLIIRRSCGAYICEKERRLSDNHISAMVP
jgi:LacI family transcriptional regulator